MTFDPNDFQDQAAIAAMLQRQRLINSQNQYQSIPKNRQCPWCGGLLPGQFNKCQHCTSDVSWVDGLPCKPQDADYLRKKNRENWEKQQAKEERLREKAEKLKSDIAARVVECRKCGCRVPQSDLESTIDECQKCQISSMILVISAAVIASAVLIAYYYDDIQF